MAAPLILVVDDNREWAHTVASVLTGEGYEVLEAYDGEQALDLLLSLAKVQLVVLDVHLPRISGFQVLSEFRRRNGCTPVLAVSADDQASVRERAMSDGASAFLQKPMSAAMLVRAVQRLVDATSGNSHVPGPNSSVPVAEDQVSPSA